MALWQIDGREELFDDGLTFRPGEEGFTKAIAFQEALGATFNYVGTPNWAPQEDLPVEAE